MLTDLKIKKLKASEDGKGKKYNDSSGLYLYVSPAGGKVFRFDYSFGAMHAMTIGACGRERGAESIRQFREYWP